ncbi:hypothetical protein NESM_000275900 [Novymonas esmeraldas]|uniref:Uncharacterized protein n=1 Tax=Novymonas esmeraldas TaxID=1808958 RepID=A0AAW0F9H0_9TRYP
MEQQQQRWRLFCPLSSDFVPTAAPELEPTSQQTSERRHGARGVASGAANADETRVIHASTYALWEQLYTPPGVSLTLERLLYHRLSVTRRTAAPGDGDDDGGGSWPSYPEPWAAGLFFRDAPSSTRDAVATLHSAAPASHPPSTVTADTAAAPPPVQTPLQRPSSPRPSQRASGAPTQVLQLTHADDAAVVEPETTVSADPVGDSPLKADDSLPPSAARDHAPTAACWAARVASGSRSDTEECSAMDVSITLSRRRAATATLPPDWVAPTPTSATALMSLERGSDGDAVKDAEEEEERHGKGCGGKDAAATEPAHTVVLRCTCAEEDDAVDVAEQTSHRCSGDGGRPPHSRDGVAGAAADVRRGEAEEEEAENDDGPFLSIRASPVPVVATVDGDAALSPPMHRHRPSATVATPASPSAMADRDGLVWSPARQQQTHNRLQRRRPRPPSQASDEGGDALLPSPTTAASPGESPAPPPPPSHWSTPSRPQPSPDPTPSRHANDATMCNTPPLPPLPQQYAACAGEAAMSRGSPSCDGRELQSNHSPAAATTAEACCPVDLHNNDEGGTWTTGVSADAPSERTCSRDKSHADTTSCPAACVEDVGQPLHLSIVRSDDDGADEGGGGSGGSPVRAVTGRRTGSVLLTVTGSPPPQQPSVARRSISALDFTWAEEAEEVLRQQQQRLQSLQAARPGTVSTAEAPCSPSARPCSPGGGGPLRYAPLSNERGEWVHSIRGGQSRLSPRWCGASAASHSVSPQPHDPMAHPTTTTSTVATATATATAAAVSHVAGGVDIATSTQRTGNDGSTGAATQTSHAARSSPSFHGGGGGREALACGVGSRSNDGDYHHTKASHSAMSPSPPPRLAHLLETLTPAPVTIRAAAESVGRQKRQPPPPPLPLPSSSSLSSSAGVKRQRERLRDESASGGVRHRRGGNDGGAPVLQMRRTDERHRQRRVRRARVDSAATTAATAPTTSPGSVFALPRTLSVEPAPLTTAAAVESAPPLRPRAVNCAGVPANGKTDVSRTGGKRSAAAAAPRRDAMSARVAEVAERAARRKPSMVALNSRRGERQPPQQQ